MCIRVQAEAMLPYPPEYDRLLREARTLAAVLDTDAAPDRVQSPRQRAAHAQAMLSLRSRLTWVLAAIADGQAGSAHPWQPQQSAPDTACPHVAQPLASLERRLADVRG